jgi:predicted branched-subunit amino acid permease
LVEALAAINPDKFPRNYENLRKALETASIESFLGAQVPSSWGLDFTLALTFMAMVIPLLKDRPSAAAALSAGLVAVLANGLPYKMGLMLAALVGITVGLLLEKPTAPYTLQATETT